MDRPRIRIGCGGWWRYPGGLREYSNHYEFIEVNCTYYGIPSLSVFQKWSRQVFEEFEFSFKAPRSNGLLPFLLERMRLLNSKIIVFCRDNIPPLDSLRNLVLRGFTPVISERNGSTANRCITPAFDPSVKRVIPTESSDLPLLYARVFGVEQGVSYTLTSSQLNEVINVVRNPPRAVNELRIVFHTYLMYSDAQRLLKAISPGVLRTVNAI